MLRKLLSDAAIYGLAAQLPRLAGVLTLPIITPYLSTQDYGIAGVVMALVSGLGFLQFLGLSVVMVNSFVNSPVRYKWVWRQLNGFISIWTLLYGLVLGLVIFLFVPIHTLENKLQTALLFAIPAMFFSATDVQSNVFFQLSQRPLPVAFRSLVVGMVVVAVNIYAIRYLNLGYRGWFYGHFFGAVAGFFINFYFVYVKQQLWPIFNFKWSRIISALRVSVPVVPHHMSFFLLDASDKLVMGILRVPLPQIGLYNVAANFGSYFASASGAIVQAATPVYMQLYSRRGDMEAALQIRRMTFSLQVLFLLATSLGSIWMKEAFEILIRNDELQQAYPIAIIILMGCNFRPMYLAVINLLSYREQTNKLWKISTVGGVANVVLNFILVPIYGYEAAAFTTFACFMYMGYAGFFMKEYKAEAMVNYYPLWWLLMTILLLLAVYFLVDSALYYKILVSVTLVCLSLGVIFLKRSN
ncbi:lipopolysaccharide biosynthesis protein [Pontibacter beigongshangensis]|uniref:lipopolysaccharide biosynthesis protein n=1 Tax=Pontibacter beigongshangensis TaxID=2574733 RepID=UPI00164F6414|nr:lipopolysaccharide biosynthesis protein [Pontibacter beigongshangensis]